MIIRELLPHRITSKPCLFLFGTFDGVHRGHKQLFEQALQLAKEKGYAAVLLTFQNHPVTILKPSLALMLLTSDEEKLKLLEPFGFDYIIDIPFTAALASLTAEEFIARIYTMIPVAIWIAGGDVAFGKDKKGSQELLEKKGKELGFELFIAPKFCLDGEPVSSSRIRTLIAQGDIKAAERLLGHELRTDY